MTGASIALPPLLLQALTGLIRTFGVRALDHDPLAIIPGHDLAARK